MNCFVMIPYDKDFEDVYATIKMSVDQALSGNDVKCFRLDEQQPAGRIMPRLMQEIRTARLCIADLTGHKPNVMWEVGYAMALEKPTVLVTQETGELPFDVHDVHAIKYDRKRLSETLGRPLKQAILDTVNALANVGIQTSQEQVLLNELRRQSEHIRNLTDMFGQVAKIWNPASREGQPKPDQKEDLHYFEGAWANVERGSHLYAKIINGELVAPYCYCADDSLTAAYFAHKRVGEYWFAKFCWFAEPISGFSFLKQESLDVLTGAWWYDGEPGMVLERPVIATGNQSRWERQRNAQTPAWAQRFFEDVEREGLISRLTRRSSQTPSE